MILFRAYLQVSRFGILKNSKQILINKRTGRPFVAKSDDAMKLENELTKKLYIEKLKQRVEMITCDVNAKLVFHYPKSVYYTKKNEKSLKLADLSNLYCLPEDCLQKAGIIENDRLISSHNGSCRKPIDSNMYYLEIELTRFNDINN